MSAILDSAGITELPAARVAVLDGIKSPLNQPVRRYSQAIRTLDYAIFLIASNAAAASGSGGNGSEFAAADALSAGVHSDRTESGSDTARVNGTERKVHSAPHPAPPAAKTQFCGCVSLDPYTAKKQFADLVQEVVGQFTADRSVRVSITVEIRAESAAGIGEGVQRAVRENCKVLGVEPAEFE